ncbi:MAG: signal peptidase I [Clostridia bacterium]|nr:signal peptidase I [Clostridia bacterium]
MNIDENENKSDSQNQEENISTEEKTAKINEQNQNQVEKQTNTNEETNKKQNQKEKVLTPFKMIGKAINIVIWVLIVLALGILIFTVASHKTEVFGYRMYIIMSGSMEPQINIKDAIITKQEAEPKVGDIIAFENGSAITVHRITKVYTEGDNRLYQTKGDNNNAEDQGLVQKSQVKGTVKVILPVVGQTVYFLQSHFIVLILAIGIIIIFILVRRLL